MSTPDTAVQALSDAQLREICTNAWGDGGPGTLVRIARAAIAADRALRAPAGSPINQPEVEREAMCAAIKAADDKAHDDDYMLDSDDCISVIRGTWKPGQARATLAATPPAPKRAS